MGLGNYCRTVLYCEADSHAQAVLLSRMSERKIDIAPICTDVREIKREFIDIPIDIIVGGFPCQDISVAGKGEGLAGERSGLFFEIVRLAEEIQPKFLFLENVSAIRTRGLDRVVQELTEVGYDSRWCMLSAADVGAPHKRERWFLLAYSKSNDGRRRLSDIFDKDAEKCRSKNEYQNTTRQFSHSSDYARILANTNSERIGKNTGAVSGEQNTRNEAWGDGAGNRSPDVADTQPSGHEAGLQSGSISSESNDGRGKEDSTGTTESNVGGVVDGFSRSMDQGHSVYLDAAYWQEEPQGIQRVTQEKEQRVERIKRLGNAVVPLQVRTAFEYLMGINSKGLDESIW